MEFGFQRVEYVMLKKNSREPDTREPVKMIWMSPYKLKI